MLLSKHALKLSILSLVYTNTINSFDRPSCLCGSLHNISEAWLCVLCMQLCIVECLLSSDDVVHCRCQSLNLKDKPRRALATLKCVKLLKELSHRSVMGRCQLKYIWCHDSRKVGQAPVCLMPLGHKGNAFACSGHLSLHADRTLALLHSNDKAHGPLF